MVKINLAPIERFIAENWLTYTAFCNHCKVSISTFSKIRKGYRVRFTTLLRIALHIHCSPYELIEEMN